MNREVYALLYSDKNDAYVPMFPLSLESLPHSVLQCRSLVDTESNWHCRTEWGWLARQLPTVAGVCCHGSFLYAFLLHPHSVSFSLHTHTHTHSNCPSLIPTDTGCGYRQPKARLGRKHVRPWKWMPFTNPARQVHVRAPSPNVIPSPLLDSEEVVSCPDPLARAKRVWCSKQNLSHGAGPILDLRSPIRLQKT